MGTDGIRRKLVVAAVALGAVLLALRVVGGRGGGVDDDGIDRVDTGRSGDGGESEGGTVETGLERVSTADTDDEVETGAEASSPATDDRGEDVPVVPTGGRLDGLDVFDVVSIVSAGVEAAREEYHNRI